MAKWLLDNKIVEQIFGPNLHIEIIKQSQSILNFLGAEGKINNQHLDCIWAAAQLKHCGKQVYEVLLPLVKSIEPEQNRHLRNLIDKLDPACYNTSVLSLSSNLTYSQWQLFQTEESQRRKLLPSVAVTGPRRLVKTSGDHMSSSDSESDEGGGPPPAKIQRKLTDPLVSGITIDMGGGMLLGEGHCCTGCLPRHTVHHLPQSQQQHHHQVLSQQQQQQHHMHHQHPHQHQDDHNPHGHHHVGVSNRRGVGSDSSMEAQSDLSYEDEEEEDNPRLRAVVQSVMARNVQEKDKEMDDNGESSDEDGGADVVVSKEGIPLPTSVRGRLGQRKPADFSREMEQGGAESAIDPSQVTQNISDDQHPPATDEEEEDDEEEEEEDDEEEEEDEEEDEEEVSSDNEESVEGVSAIQHHHQHQHHRHQARQLKEHERQLQLEAQNVIRQQRLTRQLMASSAAASTSGVKGDTPLVEVHHGGEDEEEEDEDDDDDDDDEEDEDDEDEMEEGKEEIVQKIVAHSQGEEKLSSSMSEEEWRAIRCHMQGHAAVSPSHSHQQRILEEEIEKALILSSKDPQRGTYGLSILSPDDDEGSCHSSRLSNKSEKNMADFDGEEGLSEEELVQINNHVRFTAHQAFPHMSVLYPSQTRGHSVNRVRQKPKSPASDFSLNDVCKPGHTLLWDLVQDNMANLLPEGIASEAEKTLTKLLVYPNDRQIRTKFIEAIIDNLAKNKSVVVSLRLLTELFSSFNTSFNSIRRTGGSYKVVLWAEKSLNMMTHFFNNLVTFTAQAKDKTNWTSKSVVVSLRLLTELFSSFNTSFNSIRRTGGSYKVVLWAEKSLNMMTHFFNNLVTFTAQAKDKTNWTSNHGFKEEVSSRLKFLSCVFSCQYSPDTFRSLLFRTV
ncbi:ubiquitin carboxyl-terminal hydrolase 34 [Plakobranchus ocellatus]|uniref:Ubiquitin carboxyl-terminal hydrolase 34 n=1 Tax=Plakobranchus ocellatus TaxID=259542 RepID=A0AAV3Y233_9GAST|nr:ubiquitin carboxyl-terminal hydrolase 34 [Plakobranchus ocellatus]